METLVKSRIKIYKLMTNLLWSGVQIGLFVISYLAFTEGGKPFDPLFFLVILVLFPTLLPGIQYYFMLATIKIAYSDGYFTARQFKKLHSINLSDIEYIAYTEFSRLTCYQYYIFLLKSGSYIVLPGAICSKAMVKKLGFEKMVQESRFEKIKHYYGFSFFQVYTRCKFFL